MDILVAGSSGGYMTSSSDLILLVTFSESDPTSATGADPQSGSGQIVCNHCEVVINWINESEILSLDLMLRAVSHKTLQTNKLNRII